MFLAQNLIDVITYAAPGDPAFNVELDRCGDDSIRTVDAHLLPINDRGMPVGDDCDTTPTFAEFCEATVRCRFTQTEYRAAVRDANCGADYDRARATLIYNCLPGTCARSLATNLKFATKFCPKYTLIFI